MMFFYLLACFILTLQLVGGNSLSSSSVSGINISEVVSTVSSTTMTLAISSGTALENEDVQYHQDQCAWWCNELYMYIVLAIAGTLLLISVILCIISCCLWKRIKDSREEAMKNLELDLLGPPPVPDCSRTFPIQEEPPATKDVGISDVENCNLNSGPPQKETPQDNKDQTTDESFPLPESIPMLP